MGARLKGASPRATFNAAMGDGEVRRRLPVGAEISRAGVHFRVWAPKRRRVEVAFADGTVRKLEPEGNGYHSALVADAGPGDRYRYRLDGEGPFPDPASRFQPEGPHGPSEVIDPGAFRWTDHEFRGIDPQRQVQYEMHVGTFTPEGTWAAAAEDLSRLAALGITTIEMMPIAEFRGAFGWGYDGVDLFAPTRLYGRPDDLRRFVDRAHALGLAVILDVVYNHLGPDGNYLAQFSSDYFSTRYKNEWGEPLNFDGENSGPVREFFISNAAYWIDEFHFDGLRLDATQQIFDTSKEHVITALSRRVRDVAGERSTFIVAENESQDVRLVRELGCDAVWNDDFHHTVHVALTGMREAYYFDYLGTPQELISCCKRGWLYQGQRYHWQKKRRGTWTGLVSPHVFVTFIENHDQVANSLSGQRVRDVSNPGMYRAMTALLLLGPSTPLLFQGQELGVSSPFLYFCDHNPELAPLVRKGRSEFLRQFPSINEELARLDDPGARETFEKCRIDRTRADPQVLALHRDLLKLRRELPPSGPLDGAVLSSHAFALRWLDDDRLLLVNLGFLLDLVPAPEPLLAPPAGSRWKLRWSSESPGYGGLGTPKIDEEERGIRIPARCAVLLVPEETP